MASFYGSLVAHFTQYSLEIALDSMIVPRMEYQEGKLLKNWINGRKRLITMMYECITDIIKLERNGGILTGML